MSDQASPTDASARAALERAGAILERGGETPWDAGSRLGPPGRFGRRALRRLLRPFEWRQRELDASILDAVAELSREAESGEDGPRSLALAGALPADGLIEAKTRLGPLLLRGDDELLTPQVLEHGFWEPRVSAFLVRRLRAGSTLIDVGANIGYFSLLASPLVGARGRVIAVEPDARNLALLRANLWRAHCENVTILPLAAWHERGHVRLMRQPEGGAGTWVTSDPAEHSLHDHAEAGELVPAAPLDELVEGRVDVLKVDAELTDHLVVRGAERLISANPGIAVIVELFPKATSHMGESPAEIVAHYRSLGLVPHLLTDDGEATPASDDELTEAGDFVDIVLMRR